MRGLQHEDSVEEEVDGVARAGLAVGGRACRRVEGDLERDVGPLVRLRRAEKRAFDISDHGPAVEPDPVVVRADVNGRHIPRVLKPPKRRLDNLHGLLPTSGAKLAVVRGANTDDVGVPPCQ